MSLRGTANLSGLDRQKIDLKLTLKKWIPWLFMLVAVASLERYLWVENMPQTGDLEWYLNEYRAAQYTFLNFDKRNVAGLIDQFSSYEAKLWVVSFMSGLMFSLAIFASNRNQGFRGQTFEFFVIVLLLLLNRYFLQLDMHLWRQQIAFYGFIVAVNQSRFMLKLAFAGLAFFFHEIVLLLFALYVIGGYLNRRLRSFVVLSFVLALANALLVIGGIMVGYLQISVVSCLCFVALLANQQNTEVRRNCIFIVLLSMTALGVMCLVSQVVGIANAERLVFLAVMVGLFLFFNTTTSATANAAGCSYKYRAGLSSANDCVLDTGILKRLFLISLKFLFVVYYAYASII